MVSKKFNICIVIAIMVVFSSSKFSTKNLIAYEDFNSLEVIKDDNNLLYLKESIVNIVSSNMHAGIWTKIDEENKDGKTVYNIKCYWGLENKNIQISDDIYILPLSIKEIENSEAIEFYYNKKTPIPHKL